MQARWVTWESNHLNESVDIRDTRAFERGKQRKTQTSSVLWLKAKFKREGERESIKLIKDNIIEKKLEEKHLFNRDEEMGTK